MAGIVSVRLAGAGARVSPTVVEGEAGLLAAFGKMAHADQVRAFADGPVIDEVFFKEVPACNYAQAAAQAARDLATDAALDASTLDTSTLDEIIVRVPAAAALYPGCDATVCHETLQAKMSIQYNVAAALLSASFDEANYVPARQPGIAALARRVRLEVDDALTRAYPKQQGAEVTIRTVGGQHVSRKLENLRAADEALVTERFRRAAEARYGDTRAHRLADVIDNLDGLASVAPLFAELGD
jgi:2-methylcitrate dehydratase PrpD